jgi:putative CocE/NonD family hydrolase
MRDKVKLSVDIYQPKSSGRFPALLVHTPYSNNSAGYVQRAKWFARRGYAVVLSDCRGRYDSEGTWDPFDRRHKTDGHDLVEWIARQPWCTGKVGMLGASYSGWTQWWTATQAPPALKAIVPEAAPPDHFQNCPYQNGILVSWAMDWAATMAGRTNQVVAAGPYGGFQKTRARDLMYTPYVKLNERRGALDCPWFEHWIRDNLSTADYWRAIAYPGQVCENHRPIAQHFRMVRRQLPRHADQLPGHEKIRGQCRRSPAVPGDRSLAPRLQPGP